MLLYSSVQYLLMEATPSLDWDLKTTIDPAYCCKGKVCNVGKKSSQYPINLRRTFMEASEPGCLALINSFPKCEPFPVLLYESTTVLGPFGEKPTYCRRDLCTK
jgi:hypothetical protein